jgi:hypothetical protein
MSKDETEFACPSPHCPGRVKALAMRTHSPPESEPAETTLCSITRDGEICCSHLVLVKVVQE